MNKSKNKSKKLFNHVEEKMLEILDVYYLCVCVNMYVWSRCKETDLCRYWPVEPKDTGQRTSDGSGRLGQMIFAIWADFPNKKKSK